jgi:N-acetylglutamate synthase-like GNAT family acetyltransferase
VPEITTLIAKPEGLVPGQTTTVKGGGSSLLERLVQRYKAKNVEKIRLYSAQDDYYSKRGWEDETDRVLTP